MLRNLAFSEPGGFRASMFWRLFGLCLFLSARLTLNNAANLEHLRSAGPDILSVLACGLLLVLYGGRLFVLFLTCISTWAYILPILTTNIEVQISEEFLLFLIIPPMGVLLNILSFASNRASKDLYSAEYDRSLAGFCRILVTISLFWAAFHKFNHDFLNPEVSCAPSIMSLLSKNWHLPFPAWLIDVHPALGIAGEMIIPILLWVSPRLGILTGMFILGLLAHTGPVPFTLTIIVLIWMFLSEEDGQIIQDNLKGHLHKNRFVIAVGLLIFTTVSANTYIGERKWQIYMIFQTVWLGLMYLWLVLIEGSLKKSNGLRSVQWALPKLDVKASWPKNKVISGFLIVFSMVYFVNCFTPYLGMKYRLAFAMLSNLRTDQYRWNSVLVPEWVKIIKEQPYIHVSRVDMDQKNFDRMKQIEPWYDRTVYEGYFTPISLKNRLDVYLRSGIKADIEITQKGESVMFKDAARNPALWQWLHTIPDSKMFIKYLSDGPQECYH